MLETDANRVVTAEAAMAVVDEAVDPVVVPEAVVAHNSAAVAEAATDKAKAIDVHQVVVVAEAEATDKVKAVDAREVVAEANAATDVGKVKDNVRTGSAQIVHHFTSSSISRSFQTRPV